MGDQLEQFISENKEAFNDIPPSDHVWRNIDRGLRKKDRWLQLAWRVAAVLFLGSTIYLLAERSVNRVHEGPTFSEEFQQAEDYYTQLINLRREEIKERLTPEQLDTFLEEIDQLDLLYDELKKTYKTNAASERLLDAMINNLQLRLNILNKQLEILENIKGQNDESESIIEI